LSGGDAEPRLERTRQMRLIGEAALDGDAARTFAGPQQFACLMHPPVDEPGMRCQSRRLAEHADQVPGAQARVPRHLDERRMLWAAGDIVENRPALSRWHPDYAEAFARFVKGE